VSDGRDRRVGDFVVSYFFVSGSGPWRANCLGVFLIFVGECLNCGPAIIAGERAGGGIPEDGGKGTCDSSSLCQCAYHRRGGGERRYVAEAMKQWAIDRRCYCTLHFAGFLPSLVKFSTTYMSCLRHSTVLCACVYTQRRYTDLISNHRSVRGTLLRGYTSGRRGQEGHWNQLPRVRCSVRPLL